MNTPELAKYTDLPQLIEDHDGDWHNLVITGTLSQIVCLDYTAYRTYSTKDLVPKQVI